MIPTVSGLQCKILWVDQEWVTEEIHMEVMVVVVMVMEAHHGCQDHKDPE